MLLLAMIVSTEPSRYLQAWNGPPAPGLTELTPLPAPPDKRPGVVVLLIDGLGRTPAMRLTKLKEMRQAGADVRLTAAYPSKSRPAYITLLTGLPPELHGGRNNRTAGTPGLDTLLARVRAAGLGTACVGDRIGWFAELAFGGCESAKTTMSNEEFIRAADEALRGKAHVVVLHWLGVDWNGHEHGGASGQYAAAARDADTLVEMVRERSAGRAVVVIADHGHSARGGHGGDEPSVMEVPLVLSGPGVTKGAAPSEPAQAEDVASTLAVLAGVAVPAASIGKPLWEVLEPALRARRGDHADAVRTRAARPAHTHKGPGVAWPILRIALALLAVLACARPRPRWAVIGALTPALALLLLVGRGDPLTLSAVDQAPRFVSRLLGYSAPAAVFAGIALARSSATTMDASLKAIALAAGAVAPWLLACCWTGFRPYPELPTPVAGFLPVALAIPAVVGLFSAALTIPIAAWRDP